MVAPEAPPEPALPTPTATRGRDITLAVTNLTKLAGAVGAMNELIIRESARPIALLVIALMIAGVQKLEDFALRALDRVLGPAQ